MEKIDTLIIGAGVIGLACGYELSKTQKDIFIIEYNDSFGQETSSRNSEVIHAGIYYPEKSLKSKTCIEGNQLLYEFCEKFDIGHNKIGKLIVAINNNDILKLNELYKNGLDSGVNNLKLLNSKETKQIEPNIKVKAAIHSPSTGILDTHSLMKTLTTQFKSRGGQIIYNTKVIGIDKQSDGYKISVKDKTGEPFKFLAKVIINSAGLNSSEISKMAGINKDSYKLNCCKGDYFRVHTNKNKFVNRLIYPVPNKENSGLGIHLTLDLAHSLRLGPDTEYIKTINYNINEIKKPLFHESVKSFLPFIELNDLKPDMAGIRPKLQGPGENFRDFIIKDESDNGFKGFINLIGIESPGLTASLSIAKLVDRLVKHSLE